MKLIRFGEVDREKPGAQLENGTRLDVFAFGRDYNEDFFGMDGIDRLRTGLVKNEGSCPIVTDGVRLGAPLVRPSKIVCVGFNYAKHAAEIGMAVPTAPVLFFKAPSAMVAPNPFGVGLGFVPPKDLKPGDVVELGIEGLGSSKQTARAYPGK